MKLTRREHDIAVLVSQDKTDKEIAKELGISVNTVSEHVHEICTKLGARGRLGMVMLAIRDGELSWEEVFSYWMRYPEN